MAEVCLEARKEKHTEKERPRELRPSLGSEGKPGRHWVGTVKSKLGALHLQGDFFEARRNLVGHTSSNSLIHNSEIQNALGTFFVCKFGDKPHLGIKLI